jgi:hypothetical protein
LHRRAIVAFAVLLVIKARMNVLELADNLRNFGLASAEIADTEVGFAFAACLAGACNRELWVEVEGRCSVAVSLVTPSFDKKALDEASFCLGLFLQVAIEPVVKAFYQRRIMPVG